MAQPIFFIWVIYYVLFIRRSLQPGFPWWQIINLNGRGEGGGGNSRFVSYNLLTYSYRALRAGTLAADFTWRLHWSPIQCEGSYPPSNTLVTGPRGMDFHPYCWIFDWRFDFKSEANPFYGQTAELRFVKVGISKEGVRFKVDTSGQKLNNDG